MSKQFDVELGLNYQAWAVLRWLAAHEFELEPHQWLETASWYNGRERGILLSCHNSIVGGPTLFIAIYEHRNSDSICAVAWETEQHYMNPPTIEDVPEAAFPSKWDVTHSVEYGNIVGMADWVIDRVQTFAAVNCKQSVKG